MGERGIVQYLVTARSRSSEIFQCLRFLQSQSQPLAFAFSRFGTMIQSTVYMKEFKSLMSAGDKNILATEHNTTRSRIEST